MPSTQQQQMTPQQANALASQLIRANAVEMKQTIFTQTFDPRLQNVINVIPRNVGLIKGYWLEVVATLPNASGSTWTITPLGLSNILQQIVFNDLNNNVRINTAGWHLEIVNSVKARRAYGSVVAPIGSGVVPAEVAFPIGYGANFNVISAPVSIATGSTATCRMVYWVPMAYSDNDLRGAVYSNVVNATQNLQLTFNQAFVTATGVDATLAGYSSAGTASQITSIALNVTQVYLDQLPMGQNGPILPQLDLAVNYELKNTNFPQPTPNQDFTMQYSNFRDFLSTIAVYNNGTNLSDGTDVTYWALRSANFTNIFQLDPTLVALQTRNIIGSDVPYGCYYFSSRNKPISTTSYGNMELVLNASTAGAGAYVLMGYEDFAITNVVTQAGSLAGNA